MLFVPLHLNNVFCVSEIPNRSLVLSCHPARSRSRLRMMGKGRRKMGMLPMRHRRDNGHGLSLLSNRRYGQKCHCARNLCRQNRERDNCYRLLGIHQMRPPVNNVHMVSLLPNRSHACRCHSAQNHFCFCSQRDNCSRSPGILQIRHLLDNACQASLLPKRSFSFSCPCTSNLRRLRIAHQLVQELVLLWVRGLV